MSEDKRQHIVLLNQLVVQLNQQGRYEQAIDTATLACDLARQHLGNDHPFLATSLNNLAELYRANGNYTQAESLYQQALEIKRRAFGEFHPSVATSLHNLAGLYQMMGDYARAEQLYRQALEIKRAALGEAHPDMALSLNNLALLYKAKGNYTQAELLYRQVLSTRRTIFGETHPSVATSLNNLAELYRAMGDYARAEPLYQQALEIKRTALGETHPDVATCQNNLALLYLTRDDYAQAESLYQRALEIRRTALGETHPDVADSLNNLAELYRAMGDYAQAELLHQQALMIWNATLGKTHPNVAASLNNLAELYRAMGDYAQAELLHQQALETNRTVLGEAHPSVATGMNNLAELHREMGNYAQAEQLYQQALVIRRMTLGEAHPDVAQSLNNLASLRYAEGDYPQAEQLYQQALAVRRSTLGEAHPVVAQSLNNLAVLYMATGDYTRTEPLARQAVESTRTALGEVHPQLANTLNNLAMLYVATDRTVEALTLMKQAAAIDDQVIGQVFSIGSERQRMAYLRALQGRFEGFLSLIQRHLSHSTEAVLAGLDLVLRRKAIGAEALAVQRDALLGGRYPELAAKLHELATLRMQVAQKTLAGPGPEGIEVQQQRLKEWNTQKERLEAELARQVPEMTLIHRLQTANRQAVTEALSPGTALVEFVRFDVFDFRAVPARGETRWKPARYAAFVLNSELGAIRLIDLGEANYIDQLIVTFIASIIDEADTTRHMKAVRSQPKQVTYATIGSILRAVLFDPLHTAIHGCKRLLLAPDGDLTRLPFEVLPTDDGHYVIDDYQISYLSTGRDVLRFATATPDQFAPPLVVADPDFDLGDEKVPASTATTTLRGRQSRDLNRDTLRFEHLPGTRIEGEQIAALLGVQPLLEGAALEGTLKATRSPRILHIATHGFFLPDQQRTPVKEGTDLQTVGEPTMSRLERFLEHQGENPLLRSGLALAGANTWNQGGSLPPEAEDGLLTAEDVSGLDLLDTELVVLSACETGLGKIHVGEGVFGLRRAFVLAGARTLVMSLWKVPDKHTQELMGEFYHRLLEGQPRADALRTAQLTIRERYPHPFYCGAFICQGDPGPLASSFRSLPP